MKIARLALAFGVFLLGCSDPISIVRAPSKGAIAIEFPSTEAAIGADTIQYFAFDRSDSGSDAALDCPSLVFRRKMKQTLPTPIFDSGRLGICNSLLGDPQRPFTLAYGDHLVFVIAQRGDEDYLVGCATKTVSHTDQPTSVKLDLIDVKTPVPRTTCKSLAQWCAAGC